MVLLRSKASANCKLELKFAQQSGVPIVPVMMIADFQASGWLGIITAGTLWTAVHGGELDDAVDKLVIQMQSTLENHRDQGMMSADSSASDADVDESDFSSTEDEDLEFSVQEMRDELQRLMADLRLVKAADGKAVVADGTAAAAAQMSSAAGVAENALCPLPAGVPQLPPGLWVTAPMQRLLTLLQQPAPSTSTQPGDASHEVGFCGMGGIGKTVVSAWLARNVSVRSAFERIVWVTFGPL